MELAGLLLIESILRMIKVEEESQLYHFPSEPQRHPEASPPQPPQPATRKSRVRRSGGRGGRSAKGFNSSLWKAEENAAYMCFLVDNYALFLLSNNERRLRKINVLMSQAVRTRSPDQCRSHHQKMMKFHHDIPSIVEHIRTIRTPDPPSPSPQQRIKIEEPQPT